MAREMLKLRKGDSAIMIKTDGSVELAGVNDKPLMNDKGMISPVVLFAAAWAKKDEKLMNHMVDNFKNCVREGYFGPDAQSDYKAMEVQAEKDRIRGEDESASGAVTFETPEENLTQMQEGMDKHDITAPVGSFVPPPVPEIVPNISPEEAAKHKAEEDRLKSIVAQGQDPAVLRQMEAMKAGATDTTTTEYTGHKNPEEMLDVRDGQTQGTVTIEEKPDNEDQ